MWDATIAQTISIHSEQDIGNLETGGWGLMACLQQWGQLPPQKQGLNLLKELKTWVKTLQKLFKKVTKHMNFKSFKTSAIGQKISKQGYCKKDSYFSDYF